MVENELTFKTRRWSWLWLLDLIRILNRHRLLLDRSVQFLWWRYNLLTLLLLLRNGLNILLSEVCNLLFTRSLSSWRNWCWWGWMRSSALRRSLDTIQRINFRNLNLLTILLDRAEVKQLILRVSLAAL